MDQLPLARTGPGRSRGLRGRGRMPAGAVPYAQRDQDASARRCVSAEDRICRSRHDKQPAHERTHGSAQTLTVKPTILETTCDAAGAGGADEAARAATIPRNCQPGLRHGLQLYERPRDPSGQRRNLESFVARLHGPGSGSVSGSIADT